MAEKKIVRGMPDIMKKTGHDCPKNARRFCHNVLRIHWLRGQPAFDEALFDERLRAYNEGSLDALLRKARRK
jgi:hypothetical protein